MTLSSGVTFLALIIAGNTLALILMLRAIVQELRDLTAAIRERAPALYVRLSNVPPTPARGEGEP